MFGFVLLLICKEDCKQFSVILLFTFNLESRLRSIAGELGRRESRD